MLIRFYRGCLAACLGVALTASAKAHAEGLLQVALEYDTANVVGCPSEFEFRETVAELLEYNPFVGEAPHTVSVGIAVTNDVLVGLVQWRDSRDAVQGERRFDSPESGCAKLVQNMAFAVTVQIQLLNAPRSDPLVPPSPARELDAAPPAAPPSSRPTPARSFTLGAGGGPFMVFGWAPHATVGGSLVLAARGQTVSADAGFEMSVPIRFEQADGSGFETWVLAASLAPCLRFQPVEACSVFRFGQIRVQGFGVEQPRSPSGPLYQAGLRLALTQALGERLDARVHAEGVGTLSPWTVELNGMEAYSLPPFSFLLGIDLVAFFL